MYRTKQQKRVIYHYIKNFIPFPTIKENEVFKEPLQKPVEKPLEKPVEPTTINLPRIIYAAAQKLLRDYPLNVPVLIYQFHSNITHTGFDVFMEKTEKTEKGWKEWVNIYPFHTELEHNFYLIDGLALAIQQELEMTERLPSLMSQSDWIRRLMD